MKRVLIISPYFPPTNAADMQRVRMSLPYFEKFGWQAEVVAVNPQYSDMATDPLLIQSISPSVPIHRVNALSKRWTAKFGLGSIALRSLFFYRQRVNRILRQQRFDLIYFSTTQFPVCVLGAYWKKKFGVPYVIDMQDPWHSDFYEQNPEAERPPKYWFAYRLGKYLEPLAMRSVDGLLAVSTPYLHTLTQRYANCRSIPQETIPFGFFKKDFDIARHHIATHNSVLPANGKIHLVYIGRGGKDMQPALAILFEGFQQGLLRRPAIYQKIQFSFFGTSYAEAGKGKKTVLPVAEACGVAEYVTESTDRVPFYQVLNTLASAGGLVVPGSNDPQYTASKIYPYVLTNKPLLAVFHPASSVVPFLQQTGAGDVVTFDDSKAVQLAAVQRFIEGVATGERTTSGADETKLEPYSAETMTARQCALFDLVVKQDVTKAVTAGDFH